jgi:NADH-quinone oxidoreductase subunit N
LALLITIFVLSLSGIPLTAGFLSKFLMLKATLAAGGSLWLVIVAVVMAVISISYYFRILQAMYFKNAEKENIITVSPAFKWTLAVLAAFLILLGIFPNLIFGFYYF